MDKKSQRNIIKNRLSLLDEKTKKAYDKVISLKAINALKGYKNIGIYMSLDSEVNTQEIIDYCLNNNINIYIPKVDGNNMHFYQLNENTKLERNNFGILEPINEDSIDPSILDLIFVPLVAYDSNMNRLGKGKGYYDKYLKKVNAKKISLAYSLMQLQKIVTDEYDMKIDEVIDEEEL